MSDLTPYETRLKRAGLRLTAQRRVILRILTDHDDHPDATEIHRRAVERDPRISLATV